MIGPRGIDIDGDYQDQDSYFNPNVTEVRENPPQLFPPKSAAERMALAEKRGDAILGGWETVTKRSIKSGWPGYEVASGPIAKQLRRDEALRLIVDETP